MLDVNEYYKSESDYLKADDLENGKKFKLTIKGLSETNFDEGKPKITLEFSESDKKLALNKTNAMTIASVHGPNAEDWVGKQIYVYRTKVQFGDKMVDAVRVEPPMQEANFQEGIAHTNPEGAFVGGDPDVPF